MNSKTARWLGMIIFVAMMAAGCSPVGTIGPMFTSAPSDILSGATEVRGTAYPAGLHVVVSGCETSMDVRHGLGEVTNTYVYVNNSGTSDLKNVTITVNANDEERQHPDKTVTLDSIPAGYEVANKLTMDTVFNKETIVEVIVTIQGENVYRLSENCKEIAQDARDKLSAILGRLHKIQ